MMLAIVLSCDPHVLVKKGEDSMLKRCVVAGVLAGFLAFWAEGAYARDCVGVISAGGGYSFWGEVGRGARQAGDEMNVDIYFRGPADENSPTAQRSLIAVVEQMHCKALVLAPNVPELAADVARLKAEYLPTVYIDRDFGDKEALAVVATDNFRAGQMAAQQMVKALNGHGTVAVFHMKRGVVSTDERERGFIAGANAAGLKIVMEEWLGSGVGDARERLNQIMPKVKTVPDGVFTPNESTTLATLYALRQFNWVGKTHLIGFDMSRDFITPLNEGLLYGVVVQRPFQMGYQGVMIAMQSLLGGMPKQYRIDPGTFFVTRNTLHAPEFAQDLAPFLATR